MRRRVPACGAQVVDPIRHTISIFDTDKRVQISQAAYDSLRSAKQAVEGFFTNPQTATCVANAFANGGGLFAGASAGAEGHALMLACGIPRLTPCERPPHCQRRPVTRASARTPDLACMNVVPECPRRPKLVLRLSAGGPDFIECLDEYCGTSDPCSSIAPCKPSVLNDALKDSCDLLLNSDLTAAAEDALSRMKGFKDNCVSHALPGVVDWTKAVTIGVDVEVAVGGDKSAIASMEFGVAFRFNGDEVEEKKCAPEFPSLVHVACGSHARRRSERTACSSPGCSHRVQHCLDLIRRPGATSARPLVSILDSPALMARPAQISSWTSTSSVGAVPCPLLDRERSLFIGLRSVALPLLPCPYLGAY